ncbi:MAG: beta-lactamase family protein [Alphaproteobacteria bacterium]|nr:beta-lactamase family protein [Alphaproteobacteria bacterium]
MIKRLLPLFLLLILAHAGSARAEEPVAAAAPTTPVQSMELPVLDPAGMRLADYAQGLLDGLMRARLVPGAVLVVVKDGRVVLTHGYGYADLATKREVDPSRTLFRVASVSKLLTATAVMQMVEEGKLSLGVDVNTYLDRFKVGKEFQEPVTLAQLLTHTAGFDDKFLRCCVWHGGATYPLGDYLAREMPPRVLPPGEVIAYSNHGYALAGYLVERVSGERFAAYTQARILDPLKMSATRWGLGTAISPDLAVPYRLVGGRPVARALDDTQLGPAADLITTGDDMGRFMIALLNDGESGGVRVLKPETIAQMTATQFRNGDGLDGWGYGFQENTINGWRTVGHDGSWGGYGASMVLIPEAKAGFFFATNADFDRAFFQEVTFAIAAQLVPPRLWDAQQLSAGPGLSAEAVAGTYRSMRWTRGDFMKIDTLANELVLQAGPAGMLYGPSSGRAAPLTFRQVAPNLWRDDARQATLRAITDRKGELVRISIGQNAFEKVPLVQQARVQFTLIGGLLLLGSGIALGWGVYGPLARRFGRRPRSLAGFDFRLIAVLSGVMIVAYFLTLVSTLTSVDPFTVLVETPPFVRAVAWLPVLLAILLPGLLYLGGSIALRKGGRRILRLLSLAPSLGVLATLWFAWFWNLHPWGM